MVLDEELCIIPFKKYTTAWVYLPIVMYYAYLLLCIVFMLVVLYVLLK